MGKLHRLSNVIEVLRHRYSVPVFIETGTFTGESLAYALTLDFSSWHSVDLSLEHYRRAATRFGGVQGLTLHHGDSAIVLPEILASLVTPAFFWLDAHWCFLDTARGPKDCPVLEELAAIAEHERRTGIEHLILVDDVHVFGTGPESPCIVTDDVVFVPEADWTEITLERAQDILGRHKQFRVWGDALIAVPAWIDLSEITPPPDPYSEARADRPR